MAVATSIGGSRTVPHLEVDGADMNGHTKGPWTMHATRITNRSARRLQMTTLEERGNELGHQTWRHLVDEFSQKYTRDKLKDMGVSVPPLSLHDYSESGTRVVIAAIEIVMEVKLNLVRRGRNILFSAWEVAPYEAALRVEREHLAAIEKPTAAEVK